LRETGLKSPKEIAMKRRSIKELSVKGLLKDLGGGMLFILFGAGLIGFASVFTSHQGGEEIDQIIRSFFYLVYLAGGAFSLFGVWHIVGGCRMWYELEYSWWKQDARRKPERWTRWSYGMPQEEFREEERNALISFVQSDTLPVRMSEDDRKTLEGEGTVFQEVLSEDSLFQFVVLPKGWSKRVGCGYWDISLVDGEGRQRAGIVYKPTPYDRSSMLSIKS
jgi:hypothetical protein